MNPQQPAPKRAGESAPERLPAAEAITESALTVTESEGEQSGIPLRIPLAAAPGRGQVEPLHSDERRAALAALAAARTALDAGDAARARAAIVALERALEAAGEGEAAATA